MDSDFQTVFVLVLLFVVAVLAFAVLVLVEERRTPVASSLTLIPAEPVVDEADEYEECEVCHGMGARDVTDEDDRPILYDVECWACDGTGRIEVGA